MSDDLMPYSDSGGSLLPSRLNRQTTRELARIRASGALTAARSAAKVEAISEVTGRALVATAHVSAIEGLLIQRTPHAAARLQHIADTGAIGMSNVVLRMGS